MKRHVPHRVRSHGNEPALTSNSRCSVRTTISLRLVSRRQAVNGTAGNNELVTLLERKILKCLYIMFLTLVEKGWYVRANVGRLVLLF